MGESPPKLGASGSVQTRVNLRLSVTLKSTFLSNQLGDPLSSRTREKSNYKLGGKVSNGIFQFCPSFWLKGRLCKWQDGDIKMEGLVNSPCYLDSWYLRSRNSLEPQGKGLMTARLLSVYLLCSPLGGQFHLHELQSQRKPVLLVSDTTRDIKFPWIFRPRLLLSQVSPPSTTGHPSTKFSPQVLLKEKCYGCQWKGM